MLSHPPPIIYLSYTCSLAICNDNIIDLSFSLSNLSSQRCMNNQPWEISITEPLIRDACFKGQLGIINGVYEKIGKPHMIESPTSPTLHPCRHPSPTIVFIYNIHNTWFDYVSHLTMYHVSEKSVAKAKLTSFYIGGGGNQLWTIWVSRMPKLCSLQTHQRKKERGRGGRGNKIQTNSKD